MKRTRHSEEEIIDVLKRVEAGENAKDVCRGVGICEQTFYAWKRKYQGMGKADLVKMRFLEKENNRLKHIVADLTLDNRVLKEINSKNW